jgi:UDP-3-O-[3-hydroxymyristoyl] glucosamine N-acyltransferase
MSYSISQLAAILDLPYQGDGARMISRVTGWEEAEGDCLIFVEPAADRAGTPSAGCVIAPPGLVSPGCNAILSAKPKLDFARAAAVLLPRPVGEGIRHPSSVVDPTAQLATDVDVGPHAVVAAGAKIGAGSVLHAGVVVGAGCVVGQRCILHPRVVLYPRAVLGDGVVLHAGAVIGGDGFGYVFDGTEQVKFPQVGSVVVGDGVEIGANSTVDRGSLGVTRIGAGSKIDNLVQIAHNVEIGRAVVIAAQTGISGSCVIEDYAVIGGQVGFGDHVHVQRGAVIGSKAGVLPGKIVRSGEVYWGVPIRPLGEYKRLNALFGRLPDLKADLDLLKKTVADLRKHLGRNA